MKATLILEPGPGEPLTGAVVAEVQQVTATDGGTYPAFRDVDVCHIEHGGTAASIRLEREAEGIPLFVYVRSNGAEKPATREGS